MEQCEMCGVSVETERRINRRHYNSKLHLKNKKLYEEAILTVFIRGHFEVGDDELQGLLSQFGNVTKHNVRYHNNGFYGFFTYSSSAEVDELVSASPLKLGNNIITVQPKKYQPLPGFDKPNIVDKSSLLQKNQLTGDISSQMLQSVDLLKLSPENMREREEVIKEISQCLRVSFSLINITPFGSTTNGIGFSTSDLDLFVTLETSKLPLGLLTEKGRPRYKRLCHTVQNRLSRCPALYQARTIFSSRLPLVKCFSRTYGFSIDLLFKRNWGVFNSRFINDLVTHNPRLRSVMYVVKYWGKQLGLTGMASAKTMSSYALMLLTIFSLQQTDPPFLPPVSSLLCGPPRDEDPWNFNYSMNSVSPSQNDMSALQLLRHFFHYYIDFPYRQDLICPYFGYPLPRGEWINTPGVESAAESYKRAVHDHLEPALILGEVCVQDMFELNFNTAVTFKNFDKFKSCCKVAASICEKWCTFVHPDANLCELFDEENYSAFMENDNPRKAKAKQHIESTDNQEPLSKQPSTLVNLRGKGPSQIIMNLEVSNINRAIELVRIFFTEALLLKERVSGIQEGNDMQTFVYSSNFHFWLGRKMASKQVNKQIRLEAETRPMGQPATPSLTYIQVQEKVSKVLEERDKDVKFIFEFSVTFISKKGQMVIKQTASTEAGSFGSLREFLSHMLPKLFNEMLSC